MLYVAKRDSADVRIGKIYKAIKTTENGVAYYEFVDDAGDVRYWHEERFEKNFEPKQLSTDEEFRNALL